MSEQPLDLRRSLRIVWRHRLLAGIVTAIGLAAGAGYTAFFPPMASGTALVVLAPSYQNSPAAQGGTMTQVVVAGSDPVLAGALRAARLKIPLAALRARVTVGNPADDIVSITAQGGTAAQADRTANAVARSYVAYLRSGKVPGAVPAQVLQTAADASAVSLVAGLLTTAGAGALAGFLVGGILALAIGHSDQRLRERDAIAQSTGAPVLASIPVHRPGAAGGWRELLEKYQPSQADAWQLRRALDHLNLAGGDSGCVSVTVVSLASDRKALALGPQLAVSAAALGIPTALVIGPHQDADSVAALRAACLAPPKGPANLRVMVRDRGITELPSAELTVIVTVVGWAAPEIAGTIHTTSTMLGVSAGAASAGQLARVAGSLAAGGRPISGVLVADPDSADHTAGLLPRPPRPAQHRAPAEAGLLAVPGAQELG